MTSINERVAQLRAKMKAHGLDAYIIPTTDPHQSEYIAKNWKDREWISGFTGSAGSVAITHTHAGLWTDSRYFIQGEMELKNTEFTLHKLVQQFEAEYIDFLIEELPAGSKVGVDDADFSKSSIDSFIKKLEKKNIQLITAHDIVSEVWTDRPNHPTEAIFEHNPSFVGHTRIEKIEKAREFIKQENAQHLMITALDEIAYLFNLRGNDVSYNPVFISYAMVSLDQVILFTNQDKINPSLLNTLQSEGITIMPYDSIIAYVNNMNEGDLMIVENNIINGKLFKAINCKTVNHMSPVKVAKGVKHQKEIDFYTDVMVDDGMALANAYYQLENKLGKEKVTEHDFAVMIAEARKSIADYRGESFGAIIGYKGNGAIIHYNPTEDNCTEILPEGVLLVDCGGQYERGTTDITRTIAVGKVSDEAKKHYTLVLKGHIALSNTKFPKGATGSVLETLARQFLWNEGLNYLHGTGHGVGYFLNVHEGPFGFAHPTIERGRVALAPGMVITNEPGIYITDNHGIRVENIMVVQESSFKDFLEFKTITLYPYDLNMINESMLTSGEKAWINNYQRMTYDKIAPKLDDKVREWFHFKCKMFG